MSSKDLRNFWIENNKALQAGNLATQVPVDLPLPGDWVCVLMEADMEKYYREYQYQQDIRRRCNELTLEELGCPVDPAVDFGVIMDASIYGGKVHYESNATPTLVPVVQEPEEIDALVDEMDSLDDSALLERGLIPLMMEWRSLIKQDYGVDLSYGTSMKGCATMMGQICGLTNFLTWILTDPEPISRLCDCWGRTSQRYVKALRTATGTPESQRGFSFQSDVAGMLSNDMYTEFIKKHEEAMYLIFAPQKADLRYFHADYHMKHLLPSFREMGVNAVNIDPYIDCNAILEILPDCVIYGQIPPTSVLLYGSKEDVAACVRRDIDQAGPGHHLIISTAGSINPGTGFEQLRTIIETAVQYGKIYDNH
jgi:uroporphyrinogen-III decarboxylase